MRESTAAIVDKLVQGMLDASDGEIDAKYEVAVFLRDVAQKTTQFPPEEAEEVRERLKFSATKVQRYIRVATVMGKEEFDSLKGLTGATGDITFSWSHIVELATVGNKPMRSKLVKAWKKADEKDQSTRAFAQKIKSLVTPPVEPGAVTLTPKRGLAKLASVSKKVSELFDDLSNVDLGEAVQASPDTAKLVSESIVYIWTTLPSIAAGLGLDLNTLGDVSPDEDEIDEDEDEDDDDTADEPVDDQDDGTEEDEDVDEDEDDEAESDTEDDEAVDSDDTEAEEATSTKLAKKRVRAGTHSAVKDAAPASLEDAEATAANGPVRNRRRGK